MQISIVVITIILVIGLFVGLLIWNTPARRTERMEKAQKALLENTTPGKAKIIEVGASEGNRGSTEVALRLEVTPEFGESFNAITIWAVEPAHMAEIQAGKSVPVKIRETQTGSRSKSIKFKSIFPAVDWAELWYWAMEFTEETMKTMEYK
jgi:hypothetical protein